MYKEGKYSGWTQRSLSWHREHREKKSKSTSCSLFSVKPSVFSVYLNRYQRRSSVLVQIDPQYITDTDSKAGCQLAQLFECQSLLFVLCIKEQLL